MMVGGSKLLAVVHIQDAFDSKVNRLPDAWGTKHERKRGDPDPANITEIIPPNCCKIYESLNAFPERNFYFEIIFSDRIFL